MSEESTFEEDLEKGNHVRLRINTQKLNVFSEDGSRNLIKGVSMERKKLNIWTASSFFIFLTYLVS